MGTPAFAVPALEYLINSTNHQVVSIFTQMPKAKGRGLEMAFSPVHELAIKHNIPVHTPRTLRAIEITELVNTIKADIIVVVAYGFIVPLTILKSKKYGCLNIHPSNLPRHRGAAPLQRTIIEGDTTSAVCIMQMDEGLDTGDILLQEKFDLPARITLPELHDKCAKIGGELLLKVLNNIDNLPRIPQTTESSTYASKLKKEEGFINWQETSYQLDCKIRGMNPWPSVYFKYNDKIIKVLEANYSDINHSQAPGTVINNNFEIACGRGTLILTKLQQEGKRPLFAEEFLRGMNIPIGTVLKST